MLLALLLACAPPQEAARATLRRREVLLAHTNDLHAHFRPVPAPWLEGSPRIGGFEAIDAHLRSLRAAVGDVVYLDGGDLMTGTPLMELAEDGVAGGAMLRFLEAAGCDAWVVGNHELDRGIEHARQLVASSGVPVLTANLMDRSGQPLLPGSLPHHIVEHNNLKIGVFGLTTDAMASLTARETAAQLQVRSLAAVAREQVAVLEPQVDLVVALTHSGLDGDMALAEAVDGIDLIVGGHTHSSVEPPILVDGTWIVQAGSYGRQLGLVRLTVDDGEVGAFSGALVDLRLESLPGDASPAVRALSRRMASAVDAAYGQQLGVLPAPLERGGSGESPMGRWGAEAVRRAAGADVGAVNAGGLRADLAAGPVTKGALYQVFPFSNQIATFSVSGEALVGILLRSASRVLEERVPLQMSGVALRWRVRLGAPEVISVTVGGEPLVLDRMYTIATSSFLADQGERRFGVSFGDVELHDTTILDAAAAAVVEGSVMPSPPVLQRID